MKRYVDAMCKFENEADLVTFIGIFGSDRGKDMWNTYKTRCNYSPLRLYKDLSDDDKEIMLGKLSTFV